jgi:CopG family nickel-responsive transcriptional regulator
MGVDAMRRITISIDDELLATLERLGARRGYGNRFETLRDMIREAIGRERSEHDERARCLATLTYVYEHEKRDLARRLTQVRACGDDHVLFYNCSEPP